MSERVNLTPVTPHVYACGVPRQISIRCAALLSLLTPSSIVFALDFGEERYETLVDDCWFGVFIGLVDIVYD